MQCSQPFCGTGFLSNFGPTFPCNFAIPQVQQPTLYPEIIGEGEVASVVYPDGSVHLYFIPFHKRCPPYSFHPNHNNHTPYYNNAMGAYYVRGISNPITPAIFSQQCQKMYTEPSSRPCYISNCNLNIPPPGFQLKFHNDCWTSTTDLQYFFPCLRQCDWFPPTQLKGCASVQVDIPVKECAIIHQEVVCTKPCLCPCNEEKYCSECESVDESLGSKQKQKSKKNKSNKSKSKQKLEQKSSKVNQCHGACTTDKSIATVADQSSGAADNERNTQTCRPVCAAATSFPTTNCNLNRKEVKTELWIPNTSFSKRCMKKKSSEKIIGLYETCSSATCCCSDTGE